MKFTQAGHHKKQRILWDRYWKRI